MGGAKWGKGEGGARGIGKGGGGGIIRNNGGSRVRTVTVGAEALARLLVDPLVPLAERPLLGGLEVVPRGAGLEIRAVFTERHHSSVMSAEGSVTSCDVVSVRIW